MLQYRPIRGVGMNKVCVQNLGMIITEKCNLNCEHCLRGCCTEKCMSDEVIEATLSQICHIGNLNICGGEITLALDRMEKIFSYIIDHNIIVDQVSMVINGTRYSVDFLELLESIEDYIHLRKLRETLTKFEISWDKFHYSEVERLGMVDSYLENIERYSKSKFFLGMRKLYGKLFREGNAENLDSSVTLPLRPMDSIISYPSKVLLGGLIVTSNREKGVCNIGPLVTVNVDGIITECDASIEHQRSLYNYGNVLNESIEEVCLNKRKALVIPARKWYSTTGREMKKYYEYDE